MTIENEDQLDKLRTVGRLVARTLETMGKALEPGITTKELDDLGRALLEREGARSAPELTYGFPGATCISVGPDCAHGIPDDTAVKAGDLKKAHDVLAEWLRANPSHQYAAMVSQQLQFLESQMHGTPPANVPPGESAHANSPDNSTAKPGQGGIPGLGPVEKAKPAPKQKDTAMKGAIAPSGKS